MSKAPPRRCFFVGPSIHKGLLNGGVYSHYIRADSDKKKLPSDKIFYLLSQRRGSVNLCNYLFVRIFVYNEFVFHSIKSLLFFHLPEEAEYSYRSYKYTVQNNGHNVSYGKLKVSAE